MTQTNGEAAVSIAYIHSSPVVSETAGGGFAVHTAHAMARQGARVALVVGRDPLNAIEPADVLAYYGLPAHPHLDIDVISPLRVPGKRIRMSWNGTFRWRALRRLRRLQNHGGLDAVICRNLRFMPRLIQFASKSQTKSIYEPHRVYHYDTGDMRDRPESDVAGSVSTKYLALERAVYGEVDGLAVLSRAFAGKLNDLFNIAVPLCVARSGAPPIKPVSAEERDHTVCYSGQLHRHKGVEVAVEAMKYVNDQSLRLLVVGGNERLDAVKSFTASHGLEKRVTFTGHVSFREAQRLAGRSKLAVAPLRTCDQNRYYTSPLKIFEYMAMQVPIVASRLQAVEEVLDDAETGILVKPDDPTDLARGIDRILDDRALYDHIRVKAYDKALGVYTWDARAKELISLVQKLQTESATR